MVTFSDNQYLLLATCTATKKEKGIEFIFSICRTSYQKQYVQVAAEYQLWSHTCKHKSHTLYEQDSTVCHVNFICIRWCRKPTKAASCRDLKENVYSRVRCIVDRALLSSFKRFTLLSNKINFICTFLVLQLMDITDIKYISQQYS